LASVVVRCGCQRLSQKLPTSGIYQNDLYRALRESVVSIEDGVDARKVMDASQ